MRFFKILAIGCALAVPQAASSGAAKSDGKQLGSGVASFYGKGFAGRRTANGESFNPGAMTAAHRTAHFGSRILVTHLGSGRQVTVRVNDRGPYVSGRIIDLSYAAAKKIGITGSGTGRVKLTLLAN